MTSPSAPLCRTAALALPGAALLLLLTACSGTSTEATALTLPAAGSPAGMCAELTPESLAGADLAVRATVVSIEGDRVTLDVDETYTGEPGDRIVLPQQEDGLPSELSIGAFAEGSTYLLSSIDSSVLTCGASGAVSPELQAVYDAAF